VGTAVTFTVEIRGPGTGDSEDVHFGDGERPGRMPGWSSVETPLALTTTATTSTPTRPLDLPVHRRGLRHRPPTRLRPRGRDGTATVLVRVSHADSHRGSGPIADGQHRVRDLLRKHPDDQKVHCATLSPPQTADMTVSGGEVVLGKHLQPGQPRFRVPARVRQRNRSRSVPVCIGRSRDDL